MQLNGVRMVFQNRILIHNGMIVVEKYIGPLK